MASIQDILTELGYDLRDNGVEWRAMPLYRPSDNPNSLRITKQTGAWFDFGAGIGGTFPQLIAKTLGQESDQADLWLENKSYQLEETYKSEKPEASSDKYIDFSILEQTEPNFKYWQGRGISVDVLKTFDCGLCYHPTMAGRSIFPIYGKGKKVVGIAGRDVYENTTRTKWKLVGTKERWMYPAFLSKDFILESGMVILLEGIPDVLKLWQNDIRYGISLFGATITRGIILGLLRLDPKYIVIATNNEPDNNNIGNNAAKKISGILSKYFDPNQIIIKLPPQKDFCMLSDQAVKDWWTECQNSLS